jgi:hypothetical protein
VQKIDTKFNLTGVDQEVITVTVNGNTNVAGVQCVLDRQIVPWTFRLDRETPVAFLDVNVDFNQAVGDTFEISVTGDAPGSFTSTTRVARAGAFRSVKYRFETA